MKTLVIDAGRIRGEFSLDENSMNPYSVAQALRLLDSYYDIIIVESPNGRPIYEVEEGIVTSFGGGHTIFVLALDDFRKIALALNAKVQYVDTVDMLRSLAVTCGACKSY